MANTIAQGRRISRSRLLDWLTPSRRRLAKLRRDDDGSTIVEFAIIAPIFFFLLFVIAETALIFIAEQVMDNAVFDVARRIRTGQVQLASTSQEDFKEEVCARMSVFVTCNDSDFFLGVERYTSFAALGAGMGEAPVDEEKEFEPEGTFDFGAPGEIVVVRAYYKWPTRWIFGGFSLASDGMDGKRLIGSFAAFRNEPFVATAQAE